MNQQGFVTNIISTTICLVSCAARSNRSLQLRGANTHQQTRAGPSNMEGANTHQQPGPRSAVVLYFVIIIVIRSSIGSEADELDEFHITLICIHAIKASP
jgi:hypothetical protein